MLLEAEKDTDCYSYNEFYLKKIIIIQHINITKIILV